jgi:hypothetical protein
MRISAAAAFLILALAVTSEAEIPNLEGTWAMVQVYPQIAVLPFAGEVPRSSTVAQFVEVTQTGPLLTMIDTYCFTIVDDGTPLVETAIPDRFMASLRPEPRTATLTEQTASVRFESSTYVEVRGAVLDNPAVDALPTDPKDPRVFDQDEDGNPGMTVRVTILGLVEGETHVVQRVSYRLNGALVEPDRIEGTIEWTDEQVVLGATNALLEADTIGYPDPDPTASRFVMIRIDETWTCETLRERYEELLIPLGK